MINAETTKNYWVGKRGRTELKGIATEIKEIRELIEEHIKQYGLQVELDLEVWTEEGRSQMELMYR